MENVIYTPGNEPEDIRKRIDRLFAKLDEAYPDKIIIGLYKDHKKWGETVTKLYRLLGYPSGNAFLEAYGYTVKKGPSGRPAEKHMEIINELKRRYPDGPTCSTLLELKTQNPDLAPKFKNLTNQADKLFGMTFAKYLEQEGILIPKQSRGGSNDESTKKEVAPKLSVEEKLIQATEKLKEKYSEDKPFTGTMTDLAVELDGVSIRAFSSWIKKLHNETVKDYLIRTGIMAKPKPAPLNQSNANDSDLCVQANKPVETVCIDGVFYVENGILKKYTGKQREVIIPDCVTRIDYDLFYENHTVRKVFISDSVTYLGWHSFESCIALKEVRLSDQLKEITPETFKHTSLEKITIPANIRKISRGAFSKCKKLKEVIIYSERINVEPSAFEGSPNVIIYCQDHLISDLYRVTGLPCKPLSSVPSEEDTNIVYYYDNIELMKSFPDSNPVEKTKNYKVIIDAKEFKVRIKSEHHIEVYEECDTFYSFSETEKNYISLEESRQEIIDADPDMGTDAYIYDARPRVDEKTAKRMEEDEQLFRFEFLKKVYRSLNNQDTIQLIAEETPKKKNGTFNLRSYLKIACAGLVGYDCYAIEIIAKAKNDTTLDIFVKGITFSPEEMDKFRDDFFTRHILKEEKPHNSSESDVIHNDIITPEAYDTKEIPIVLAGISIPVTVTKTDSSDYAIKANPLRSLNSFDFLSGNDADGYEIQLPKLSSLVESSGLSVDVFLDTESISDAWSEIKSVSQYYQNPQKDLDAFQKVIDVVEYRGMDWTQDKLNRITGTNEYISRYVYVILRSIEHIKTHFGEYAQVSADTAPRKRNGDLWSGKPTRFSGYLMEEMSLDNFGYSSFVDSYTEKDNKIRMDYEGVIEV